jgi:hypothetical protein
MTARVIELFKSRETVNGLKPRTSSGTLIYLVKDTASEDTARTAILAAAPATWDGKYLRSINIERLAATKFLVKCPYDDDEEELDVGEWRLSFDTGGGTAKKLVAYAERKYPSTAPDRQKAINVQDGKVQGLDVPIGGLAFTITYRQPRAVITLAYARTLAALSGRTNASTFYGFGAEEVMFLNARGQQGSKVDPEIDYNFVAGEHLSNFSIGGITVALKKAHEHLWADFEDEVDNAGAEPKLIQAPQAIYVDEVALTGNFALLGIGTGS